MKKLSYLIITTIIPILIILPVIHIPPHPIIPICMAAEKITPYEPTVKYTKPISEKPKENPEIKTPSKKKKWPWIVGGIVIIGAAVALAGGGGTDGGGDEPPPPEDADVDITW